MFNIYISGSITDLKSKEEVSYRYIIETMLMNTHHNYDYTQKINVFNPIKYFNNFDKNVFVSEKQVMRYDLYKLKNSDLIIADFINPKSVVTISEIAIAYEYKIPIIGLNLKNVKLHPWQLEMCDVIFNDWEELVNYIICRYVQ